MKGPNLEKTPRGKVLMNNNEKHPCIEAFQDSSQSSRLKSLKVTLKTIIDMTSDSQANLLELADQHEASHQLHHTSPVKQHRC